MKTTLLTTTLIVAFASAALASDKDAKDTKAATASAAKETAKTKPTTVQKQEVLLTGSNIKREIRRDGQVNDAPNSLSIIDRKTIERSGAADLRQVLAKQSGFR
jgi:outer membrane receptor for ferrienterochelin and colicin